jgi:hypothetical protein
MAFSLVNWWAVLAATAINMFVGFLWYGPLFGSRWLRLMEKDRSEISGGSSPLTYLIPMVAAFFSSVVLAIVLGLLRVFSLWSGVMWGALLWTAFGATALLTTGVFESRKQGLSWMFISYMVTVHAINGGMFALWR